MSNEIDHLVIKAAEGHHLSRIESARAFQIIMAGGATPAQMAALLVALHTKGESVGEIIGAAQVLRAKMEPFPTTGGVIDVCGTGGDGKGMLNISTAVAIVVAACGVNVAKHGNKSVSSRSGSADVLSALGVNVQAEKPQAQKALAEAGITFLFAPQYHKAMRHIAPVRQELGIRTIFNLLGPLANPAKPQWQLMGVYDRSLLLPMAQAIGALGAERAWVVHGSDGSDELCSSGISHVAIWENNSVRMMEIAPEDARLPRHAPEALKGGKPEENARHLTQLLSGKQSAYRDTVLLNAAAALMIAAKATTLEQGASLAASAIDSGKASDTLSRLVTITNERHP